MPLQAFSLIAPRRQLAGSLIGGIPETQEMLEFCGKHRDYKRHRDDLDRRNQRSVRAHGEERCEVSLRHRYGDALSGDAAAQVSRREAEFWGAQAFSLPVSHVAETGFEA
jgi:hypothetical protein